MRYLLSTGINVLILCASICAFADVENAVLGGIGTGKIEIQSNGRLANITINHNQLKPINDENGCFAAIAVKSGKESIVKQLYVNDDDSNCIDEVSLKGEFPFARIDYKDQQLPVSVSLRTFNSVLPGNLDDSCYPAIAFKFSVQNPDKRQHEVSLAMSWRNLIGLGGTTQETIDLAGKMKHHIYSGSRMSGVQYQFEPAAVEGFAQNTLGEHALVYQSSNKEKASILPIWHPESDPTAFWLFLNDADKVKKTKDAAFDYAGAGFNRPAAAVASTQSIPPGESRDFVFILGWYMPHQVSLDGVDHGVYYASQWKSLDKVIGVFGKYWPELADQAQAWRDSYLNSSLPGWLVNRMLNGMAALSWDGLYLNDGRFSLLTRDPQYPGNLGSPEERLVDSLFMLQCYPELLRSELRLMANCQLADGEVPSAVGNLYGLVENGNISGGFIGRPDSTSAFVLLVYQYFLWTGDREFLDDMHQHARYALRWLMYRDANQDSVPDGASLWRWGKDGVTSLFSGNLALAAFRVGEELEQIYGDLEFQNWCRKHGEIISRNLNSQLWNGYAYNAFFDPARPSALDSGNSIPGLLCGEWYASQQGWDKLFPADRVFRMTQTLANRINAVDSNAGSFVFGPLAEPGWRYGFAAASTGSLLVRNGFYDSAFRLLQMKSNTPELFSQKDTGLWSVTASLQGLSVDMHRHCLIVGPSLPAASQSFAAPFSTPLYSGELRYSRSSLSGQMQCEIEFDRVPDKKEFNLQQIAFALPGNVDANQMILLVHHNGKSLVGQDFSRESLRVFGFQPVLRVKKGDVLSLLLSPKDGPRLLVDVQTRDIKNYGIKCRIEKNVLALPGVSFYMTNLIQERQLVSVELANPADNKQYAVFINGQQRPFAVPSADPIPMLLPLSLVSAEESSVLSMAAKGCQETVVKISDISGVEKLKNKLWILQEEVNRLVQQDIIQRGVRIDVIPTDVVEQLKFPELDETGDSLNEDIERFNQVRTEYMEFIQGLGLDPVLASELTGYFVPVDIAVSASEIISGSQTFAVNVRMNNPQKSPIRARVNLDIPEGWSSVAHGDIEFDDRTNAQTERGFLFSVDSSVGLWKKRYTFDVVFSGAWKGYPFRRVVPVSIGHDFIKRWLIVGPFANARGEGFGNIKPPEHNIQTKETYSGLGGEVGWTEHEFADGYVNFDSVLQPNDNATAYAYTSIYSPREQVVNFRIGCNGDLKLFMNYQPVYAKRNIGRLKPGGVIIPHRIYQGWNHVVVKVSEQVGPWGFYFELYDPQGNPLDGVQYALDKADSDG